MVGSDIDIIYPAVGFMIRFIFFGLQVKQDVEEKHLLDINLPCYFEIFLLEYSNGVFTNPVYCLPISLKR